MAIPGWALALGAAKIAPEMANDWMSLYKTVRDENQAKDRNTILSDFAAAQNAPTTAPQWQETGSGGAIGTTIPTRKDRLRELQAKVGSGVYNPGYETGAKLIKAIGDEREAEEAKTSLGGAYSKLITAFQKDPNTPLNTVASAMTPTELQSFMKEAGGKMDDWYKAQATTSKMTEDQRRLEDFTKAGSEAANLLQPYGATISGTDGTQSRVFPGGKQGAYAPAPAIRSDAAGILSQFRLGPQEAKEINANIDKGLSDTWMSGTNPYTGERKTTPEDAAARDAERESARDARQREAQAAADARQTRAIEAAFARQDRSLAASEQRTARSEAAKRNRPLPAGALTAMSTNNENLRRAETALSLLEGKNVGDKGEIKGDKGAIGWKGYIPDTLLNRIDPAGTNTRAAIADLGSLVIHDRSGAAVTASEFPRLKPFIPLDTDDADTAKKKLRLFIRNFRNENEALRGIYKEGGYKLDEQVQQPSNPKPSAGGARTVVKKFVSKSTGKTKFIYSDGTEEIR